MQKRSFSPVLSIEGSVKDCGEREVSCHEGESSFSHGDGEIPQQLSAGAGAFGMTAGRTVFAGNWQGCELVFMQQRSFTSSFRLKVVRMAVRGKRNLLPRRGKFVFAQRPGDSSRAQSWRKAFGMTLTDVFCRDWHRLLKKLPLGMERGGCIYFMTNTHKTTLYIGVTSDLISRIQEHKSHKFPGSFTSKYNLEYCVYYESYFSIEEAIHREKELKKWRREKKDILINSKNPDWKDLWEEIKEW